MSDLNRWKGKVALVTGASSGIGRATAEALAAAGLKTVLSARNESRLNAMRDSLIQAGGEALVISTDLRKESDIRGMFDQVRSAWGGVDILVNNAGLGYQGKLTEQPVEDWREMLETNVLALTLCTQEALKDMEGKPEGHIINISSIAGHRVPPGTNNAYYSATKHAVRAFTDALRMELVGKKSRVRLGMVSPGMVETEFFERAAKGVGDPLAHYQRFRVLDPTDVADAVLYMVGTPPHVNIHDVIIRSVEQTN